jgi:hypothetical protein
VDHATVERHGRPWRRDRGNQTFLYFHTYRNPRLCATLVCSSSPDGRETAQHLVHLRDGEGGMSRKRTGNSHLLVTDKSKYSDITENNGAHLKPDRKVESPKMRFLGWWTTRGGINPDGGSSW